MFDDVEAKEFGGVENAVHTGHIGIKATIKRINSVKVNVTMELGNVVLHPLILFFLRYTG